ncbi:MAG: hypothetical protein V7765_14970 [Oleispira sp.]
MSKAVLIVLIALSVNVFSSDVLIQELSGATYEYSYNGEIVATVKHDNPRSTRDQPALMANCMVHYIGQDAGDEARYTTYGAVEIYCGKKKIIIVKPNETNIFGGIRLESPDRKWAIFLPDNDSSVPRFSILTESGELISREFGLFSLVLFSDEKATIDNTKAVVFGMARAAPKYGSKMVKSKVVILPDGSFSFTAE